MDEQARQTALIGADQRHLDQEVAEFRRRLAMRHPTVIFFWGLVAAVVLWVGAAALTVPSEPWSARHWMMRSGSLLAGRGAWGGMHGWSGGPYVVGQSGGAPQIADVERAMNQWLALEDNPRLKLGPVTQKDAGTFQADIVTKEGSLVQRFDVDRNSGRITPVGD